MSLDELSVSVSIAPPPVPGLWLMKERKKRSMFRSRLVILGCCWEATASPLPNAPKILN
jgi:hypothetical protein